MSSVTRVVISIATYRRPHGLLKLLDSISWDDSRLDTRVVVVDNDPERSAEDVVRSHDLGVEYVVEQQPGIAAARNRGLSCLTDEDYAVVFVDDDEFVGRGWLDDLVTEVERAGVDIVCGPVIPVFPEDAPRWTQTAPVYRRFIHPTGSTRGLPATNNTLVRASLLRRAGNPRFSEAFSLSGGSDSEFFNRLISDFGASFIWTERAAVFEDVPSERLTLAWAWKRGTRAGNVLGRLKLRSNGRLSVAASALLRLVAGASEVALAVVLRRNIRAVVVGKPARGWGMMMAACARTVSEYSR